jgi:hypothetical protein
MQRKGRGNGMEEQHRKQTPKHRRKTNRDDQVQWLGKLLFRIQGLSRCNLHWHAGNQFCGQRSLARPLKTEKVSMFAVAWPIS